VTEEDSGIQPVNSLQQKKIRDTATVAAGCSRRRLGTFLAAGLQQKIRERCYQNQIIKPK
jgi:hypothetical protein